MLVKREIPTPDYKTVELVEDFKNFSKGTKCYLLCDVPAFRDCYDLNPVGSDDIITISETKFTNI